MLCWKKQMESSKTKKSAKFGPDCEQKGGHEKAKWEEETQTAKVWECRSHGKEKLAVCRTWQTRVSRVMLKVQVVTIIWLEWCLPLSTKSAQSNTSLSEASLFTLTSQGDGPRNWSLRYYSLRSFLRVGMQHRWWKKTIHYLGNCWVYLPLL